MIRKSIALAALLTLAPLGAETLDAVLARMDKQAATFRKFTAKFQKTSYTAILNESATEDGDFWLMRSSRNAWVRGEIHTPDPYSFAFHDRTAQKYLPKAKIVQIFDLGKERGLIDQFLLLGFGSSGKDIQKGFHAKIRSGEVVDGVRTVVLELIPKDKKVLEQIEKVELWIPENAGYPVQQKFWQPGENYYLVKYSNVQLNPAVPDSEFQLKLPNDVKREYPQK